MAAGAVARLPFVASVRRDQSIIWVERKSKLVFDIADDIVIRNTGNVAVSDVNGRE